MHAGSGIDVVYDAALRTHASLKRGIVAFESFARSPGSRLVAPLHDWSLEEGRFAYATDAPISLAEVLQMLREHGEPAGTNAGLAVVRGVAKALTEVHPAAQRAGLQAHGSLSPWRIAILPDGSPQLLGYGLPDTELFAYLDEQQPGVSLDTLRYAPPERLDDQDEDPRSDLYTLAIIAAELMLGRPVFDGTPTSIAERVIKGDAPELIEAIGSHLGEPILDLLCVATEHDRNERFATLAEFTRQAAPLKGTGPTLQALVARAMARRTAAAAAPEPTPVAPEREAPRDERALVPSVPPMGPSPTLAEVQAHARAIVARAGNLTEQAQAMEGIADQRAQGLPAVRPLLRRLKDAVARSQKAASSTTSTARLVELDDAVDDALITLEMVRSAETLCETATQSALEILDAVQSEVDDARAEKALLDRAKRQATEALARAESAAAEAAQAATELEATFSTSGAGLPGTREQLGTVRERSEAANVASRRAKTMLQTASRQTRGADAMRDADGARGMAEEASQAAAAIQRIAKELAESVTNALEDRAGLLRTQVARASSAALAASQSLERATEATASTRVAAIKTQLQAVERYVAAAKSAAERCLADATRVLDAPASPTRLVDLETARAGAEAAAELAESQAREASTLSDRIVSRAGEAARHSAEVSKLRNESDALIKRIEEQRTEVARIATELQADTHEITGRIARDAIQVAQRATEKVAEHATAALTASTGLDHSDDIPFLTERVEGLRAAVVQLEERCAKATSRCREARGAASRELDEIAERHRQERALDDAIAKAAAHAERCKQAVASAWETYHTSANALAEASIEGMDEHRVRAYEVIDIAEFQAGEAAVAATAAADQREVAEALSHASTAESFEKRITEDLPEAIELLHRIRTLATRELEALAAAQTQTADALDAGRDAVRAVEEMRVSGSEAARDWTEAPPVREALDLLLTLASTLDEHLSLLQQADEACRNADSASSATAQVPTAAAAVRALQAARTKAEAVASTLDKAVRTARSEIETRENAVRAIGTAIESVRTMEGVLAERSKRLFDAIELHQASSEQVRRCRKRMRKAVDVAGESHDKIARAARSIHEAPTAGAAFEQQQAVEKHLARVEAALEAAAEAETQGVLAAQQEATDRVESEQRRLTHARTSSLSHLNTAKLAAAKSMVLMKEAQAELAEMEDPDVQALHEDAKQWVRNARRAATTALGAARRCQRAATADDAMSFEAETASLAADALAAVGQAKNLIQEATDLARRHEEEAEALTSIKLEINNIVTTVGEGVGKAQIHAGEVVEVTAGSTDPDTLATVTEAEDLVSSVKLASAKVDAAAPMALGTEDVEVAQGLLNTCRHALSRVEAGIDDLRALVQKAQALLSQEEERAASRLSEARHEAERPAQEARAIAEKAIGWVTAGERAAEAQSNDLVQQALEHLRQSALEVGRAAARAEEAAAPARKAADPMSARGIGIKVERFAADALEAAERTRAALDAVRAQIDAVTQLDRDAQEYRIAAAEAAAAAELCATDGASIAEELEKAISESGVADDKVANAFREVKRTAKAIATSAAAAFERTEASVGMATLNDVKTACEGVEASKVEAERLLGDLRKQDRTCRELLDGVRRKSRDEAKRSKDEALRARLRRKRNESVAIKREELKKQFEAERDEPDKPNLSALRERLRSRKRPEPRARTQSPSASIPPNAGPRRLGERPRRRRPSADGPSRSIVPESEGRQRPEPDSTSRMRPEGEERRELANISEASQRSAEEREASRRRRLERRRNKESVSGIRPRIPTSRRPEAKEPTSGPPDLGTIEKTQVGILAPEDLQEASEGPSDPREGADALLRRLRRGRRDD